LGEQEPRYKKRLVYPGN